jgi:hypothetical protein
MDSICDPFVSLPVVDLKVPTTQAVHVPPLDPVKPVLQVQAASAELGLGELELVGHATQVVATVAPTVVEYLPAPQLMQAVANVVVVVIKYFPTAQSVHAAVSAVVLYFPAC